jgi:predicted ATPase
LGKDGVQTAVDSDAGTQIASTAFSLVGRKAVLSQLRTYLGKAFQGERQVVFITGEPGIGKTTTVDAFLEHLSSVPSLRIARGQCLEQYGTGEAYMPVLDAFSRVCRGPWSEQLLSILRRHAPTWMAQMPSLISSANREALKREILGATPERMLREMAEAVEALTVEAPLVMVLEDLHWSDYSTLDLISSLARRREPARLLLLATYRPVEVILDQHPLKAVKQELQIHRHCEELPLEFLSETAVAEYLTARFRGGLLPNTLARLIHRRTDGNPLFMVNVVDYLVAQGLILQREGRWQLTAALEEVEMGVPESLRQMIERQFERLNPEEQRVLEFASVAGVEFSAAVVAAGLRIDPVKAEEGCEALTRRGQFLRTVGLVELPNGTVTASFCFVHALYQNVLYQRIAEGRQSRLHQSIGEHLEAAYGRRASEIAVVSTLSKRETIAGPSSTIGKPPRTLPGAMPIERPLACTSAATPTSSASVLITRRPVM